MELFDETFLAKAGANKDTGAEECAMTKGAFPKETPLAMAYVPVQSWERVYDLPTALARGTIFPSLDKPFIGEEAVKNAK